MLEAPPQSSYSLHLADLELDLLRGRAIRNREVLRLTPEFALLAFLMQRPGEVYDAWQLAEQVWGMQLSVFERKNPKSHAVAIAVRRLRRKIDAGRTPAVAYAARRGLYAGRAGLSPRGSSARAGRFSCALAVSWHWNKNRAFFRKSAATKHLPFAEEGAINGVRRGARTALPA